MTKSEAKLWKEYCKFIDDCNKPILKEIEEEQQAYQLECKEGEKKYRKALKQWKKRQDRRNLELEVYNSLPWYIKIFREKPGVFRGFFDLSPSAFLYIPLPCISLTYLRLKSPTVEDFNNWCVKKYKI